MQHQLKKSIFKKRYFFLLLPFLLLSYCAYAKVSNEIKRKQFLEHPPIARQVWPSATNPDGMVLNIPANYIDGNVMFFEPILKVEEEKKKRERYEQGKAELCDVYHCQELFEMLLPNYEPKNVKNIHLFKTENSKDLEEYKDRYLRLNVTSWRISPKNPDRKGYSMPISNFGLGLHNIFHTRQIFWNEELLHYMQTKSRPDLGLTEVTGLRSDVPGGFYKVLVHKQWDKKYPEDTIEDSQHHQVYFKKKNNGHVTTYIYCDSETSVVYEEKLAAYAHPKRYHCKHTFEIPEMSLDVKAYYSDRYLPQWQQIEQHITQLFKSFEEK